MNKKYIALGIAVLIGIGVGTHSSRSDQERHEVLQTTAPCFSDPQHPSACAPKTAAPVIHYDTVLENPALAVSTCRVEIEHGYTFKDPDSVKFSDDRYTANTVTTTIRARNSFNGVSVSKGVCKMKNASTVISMNVIQ